MERLFSYGTLQMEKVQKEVFGRLLCGKKDVLLGYVITKIKITNKDVIEKSGTNIHPILLFTSKKTDEIKGTVFDLSLEELKLADAYEVEEYKRAKGEFKSGNTSWIYAAR